jgi:hypothetical protein
VHVADPREEHASELAVQEDNPELRDHKFGDSDRVELFWRSVCNSGEFRDLHMGFGARDQDDSIFVVIFLYIRGFDYCG